MCGRSSLTKNEQQIEQRFGARFYSEELQRYNPLPNFNVAPTHIMPVLTNNNRAYFSAMSWGLIPSWAKDKKVGYKMINARKETIFEKRTFRSLVKDRRCIVPADGFYEWQKTKNSKQAYYIALKDRKLFAIAGLWDQWTSPDGSVIYSYTILTQNSNTIMNAIHDRMPAILTEEQESLWLSKDSAPEQLIDMIAPYDDDKIQCIKVSDKVNNVRNNDKSLIEERGKPDQLSLF